MATIVAIPSTEARTPSRSRLPTLDGWRGIAILLVLADHAHTAFFGTIDRPWARTGQHGVTVFFVLSGFLITSKLIDGPIDLKRFYVRRVFRLMPVAWAYLAFLLLFDEFTRFRFVSLPEVASCVFFYRNFYASGLTPAAMHFWSLSLEEQFYLTWPLLLLFFGARRCRWIALAGIALCATWRMSHWQHYDHGMYALHSEVRVDALLVGCTLALFWQQVQKQRATLKWLAFPALLGLAFCVYRFSWLPTLTESVCIAVLIAAGLSFSGKLPFRWLDARPLSSLGKISYSVYVWQLIFLIHYPVSTSLHLLFLLGIPVASLLSYEFIERPFTRIGHRLTSQLNRQNPSPKPLTTPAAALSS